MIEKWYDPATKLFATGSMACIVFPLWLGIYPKDAAELAARTFVRTPAEYRDMAAGQISICYELADGAKSALDAKASFATDAEANRIRKEVSAMK